MPPVPERFFHQTDQFLGSGVAPWNIYQDTGESVCAIFHAVAHHRPLDDAVPVMLTLTGLLPGTAGGWCVQGHNESADAVP